MKVVTVPCLYDNYAYLLFNEKTRSAAVVDPSEAWPVIREVEDRGLVLESILCTHHHHDHLGGLEDLLEEYAQLRVLGLGLDRARIPRITVPLEDGQSFLVCGMEGTVLHTPGHTSASAVFHIGERLFVGDTLFGAGCGRLFEGTAEEMVNSLSRIVRCGANAHMYFGHEYTAVNLRFAQLIEPENPAVRERQQRVEALRRQSLPSSPSTMAEELQTNPFLRLGEDSVMNFLRENHALQKRDLISIFAALRELRNHFS